jgi:hypothetical protein
MPRVSTAKEFQIRVGENLGAGADVFGRLRDAGINVQASCCYQIGEWAHLSFVPAEPERAAQVLTEQGLDHEVHEVLVIELPNRAGAFAEVLQEIARLGVQTRSAYVTPTTTDTGLVVLKTADNARVLAELNAPSDQT